MSFRRGEEELIHTITITEQTIPYYTRKKKTIPFKKLKKLNEPLGTVLYTNNLDYKTRDYAFIILNDKIMLKGEKTQTHSEILNEYLEQHNDSIFSYIKKLPKEEHKRQSIKDILKQSTIASSCFGHVLYNMAFVDVHFDSDADKVISIICNELCVDKIYKSRWSGDLPGKFINIRIF